MKSREVVVSLSRKTGTVVEVVCWVNDTLAFAKAKPNASRTVRTKPPKARVEFLASGVSGSTVLARVEDATTGQQVLEEILMIPEGSNEVAHSDVV